MHCLLTLGCRGLRSSARLNSVPLVRNSEGDVYSVKKSVNEHSKQRGFNEHRIRFFEAFDTVSKYSMLKCCGWVQLTKVDMKRKSPRSGWDEPFIPIQCQAASAGSHVVPVPFIGCTRVARKFISLTETLKWSLSMTQHLPTGDFVYQLSPTAEAIWSRRTCKRSSSKDHRIPHAFSLGRVHESIPNMSRWYHDERFGRSLLAINLMFFFCDNLTINLGSETYFEAASRRDRS